MGIIDGQPLAVDRTHAARARLESDVIFGCVFLGFVTHMLGSGETPRWDVDSGDEDAGRQQADLQDVLNRIGALTGVEGAVVQAGKSPTYDGGQALQLAIASPLQDGKAHPGSVQWSRHVADHISRIVTSKKSWLFGLITRSGPSELLEFTLDNERGAYYGIVDDPANTVPKVISSVRRLIPYGSEGGRWRYGMEYHGLIGYDSEATLHTARTTPKQAGSIEPTGLIGSWDGRGKVCGYCHGMVWALAEVRCNYPQGKPFELALGKQTHKLSSCFGCSTFQLANGRVASSMHLGRSESWVPLPEDENATAPFSTGLAVESVDGQVGAKERRDREVFADMNKAWAEHVAAWLLMGAERVRRAGRGTFSAQVLETAAALSAEAGRRSQRGAANLFLDALTVHDKDLNRLKRFLDPAPH